MLLSKPLEQMRYRTVLRPLHCLRVDGLLWAHSLILERAW